MSDKIENAIYEYATSDKKVRKYGQFSYEVDMSDSIGAMDTLATFKNPRLKKETFNMLVTAMIKAPELFVRLYDAKEEGEKISAANEFIEAVSQRINNEPEK